MARTLKGPGAAFRTRLGPAGGRPLDMRTCVRYHDLVVGAGCGAPLLLLRSRSGVVHGSSAEEVRVPGSVLDTAVALRTALTRLEPGLLSGSDAALLAEELARTEKACAGARVMASARAIECGSHRDRGFADGPSWLARQGGTTTGAGRQALATATGLESHPATKEALLAGEVSLAQADEIVKLAGEAPAAETALLGAARTGDLSKVRDEARAQRQARIPVRDLHRRQHRARHLRLWRDGLGMVCLHGALPPEAGVPLLNRLESLAERSRRAAKREGSGPEHFNAHLADALVAVATSGGERRAGGERRPPRAELVIVCDLFAWRRGHVHAGEPCHLVDGGPIPVELAKELSADAFVKAILHDGIAIHTISHLGRQIPAHLRTALDLGPVPDFTGAACVDCGRRYRLEFDHVDPVAHDGPTAYSNLEPRCWGDHQLKTERDRRAGLLGPDPPTRESFAGHKPGSNPAGHRAKRPPPTRSPSRPPRPAGPP